MDKAPIIGFAVCHVGILGSALWHLRRRAIFDLVVILTLTTLVIGVTYPVASLFFEPISWRLAPTLPGDLVPGVQADFLAFGVGVLLAVLVARLGGHLLRANGVQPLHVSQWMVAMTMVIGFALYALFVESVGLSTLLDRSNPAAKYAAGQGLGPLAVGLDLLILACCWSETLEDRQAMKWMARLCAACIVAWSLGFIGVRRHAVLVALSYGSVLARERALTLSRVRPSIIIAVLMCVLALEGFTLIRGALAANLNVEQTLALSRAGLQQLIGGSEINHPFMTALEVRYFREGATEVGMGYVEAPLTLVPTILDPDRPTTASQEFAADYYPSIIERGGGTGYSLVAEGYVNLGALIGPFLIGLLFASCLVGVEARIGRRPDGLLALLSPYLGLVVLMSHRAEFAVLLKQFVNVGLPVALLMIAVVVLNEASPRAHRAGF